MSKIETLKILNRDCVNALVSPEQILHVVREAFHLHSNGQGQVFPIVREALNTGGVFGIKSGGISSQGVLGFKAAGFWHNNRSFGAEPHQATILLIDPVTGRPLCMIDGNTITTLRTGAAGAVGLEILARQDSTKLTVFGTGVQASIQVNYALRVMPSIKSLVYLTFDGQPHHQFEAQFTDRCVVKHSACANEAVSNSDVVITATPGGQVLFDIDAVKPGTHFNCVGADTKGKRETPVGLLEKSKIIVDDREQAMQIGETQWASSMPVMQIGDLLTGKAVFLRTADDITVFDMTGLALQDLTVARMLFEQATIDGVGQDISWPW